MSVSVDAAARPAGVHPGVWRSLGVAGGLLMDVAWIVAWTRLFLPESRISAAGLAVWMMLIGASAYTLGRTSSRLYLRAWIQQSIAALGLGLWFLASVDLLEPSVALPDLGGAVAQTLRSLAVLLPVPHPLVIFGAVLWIWHRGSVLAGSPDLNVGREGFRFRLGVLLFGIYVAVRGGFDDFLMPELLPTFFLASMLAMAAARANSLSHRPAGGLAPFDARWMAALLSMLAGTTVLGVGAGWFLGSPPARQVFAFLGVVIGAVLSALFALALPLFLLLTPLVEGLITWLQGLFAGLGDVLARVQVSQLPDTAGQAAQAAPTPDWIERLVQAWPTIQWILLGAAAIGVVWLITRARRRASDRGLADMEGIEDLPVTGNQLGPLRQRLSNVPQGLAAWVRSLRDSPWLSSWIIRRIYARLLAKAAHDGRPKAPGETPREFEEALAGVYPQSRPQVAEITRAYELVRYGLRPEDPAMVTRVRQAWANLGRSIP